jgi:hypothetical protein
MPVTCCVVRPAYYSQTVKVFRGEWKLQTHQYDETLIPIRPGDDDHQRIGVEVVLGGGE